MDFTGELAGVGASLAFSVTSTVFTLAGRKYSSLLILQISLPIAVICMSGLLWITTGQPFPVDADPARWLWLGASAIIGFVVAALTTINAFVYIGPRLTLLISALAPVLSAVLAWLFLDEQLEGKALLGIALTISGIAWVVSEGEDSSSEIKPRAYRTGIILALVGAVGKAVSFVFSSQGVAGDFEPLAASFIRLLIGTCAIWIFALVSGQIKGTVANLRDHPTAFRHLSIGAVSGPVIGASMVLLALQRAPVGIASTLANLAPIFLIPVGFIVFKEKITRRAIVGTLVAMTGIAILFL